MTRIRKSMALFLGIWVAGSVAAYLTSRHSVHAGNGGANCISCNYCMNAEILWLTNSDGYAGSVDNGTTTPDWNAAFGPAMVYGNPVVYGTQFCYSDNWDTYEVLEIAQYNNATPCT